MVDADVKGSETGGTKSQELPFLLFRQSNTSGGELSYTDEALRVLASALPSAADESDPVSAMYILCSGWAKLLERGITEDKPARSQHLETGFIDVILSGRRRYGVKGVVLAGNPENQKQYLFMLERTSLESAHLEIRFRQYHLNRREREIVRLLLAGNNNKAIADSLGLTLNTVKSYLKLLTRKIGVSGRSEIVAAFIAKK